MRDVPRSRRKRLRSRKEHERSRPSIAGSAETGRCGTRSSHFERQGRNALLQEFAQRGSDSCAGGVHSLAASRQIIRKEIFGMGFGMEAYCRALFHDELPENASWDTVKERIFGGQFVNKKELSASAAGSISLGGNISVHLLGFVSMRLTGEGIWGPPKDRKGALAVLRRAVELDINFIDTADSYGPHVNEELIAEALFPYPAGLVIATKGGWNRPGPNQWTHDASPSHLRKAVEGSLKRLRLDR